MGDIDDEVVHLVKLAMEQRTEEVAALARRVFSGLLKRRPDLARQAREALAVAQAAPARLASHQPLPVDADSRLQLLRYEEVPQFSHEPVWAPSISATLTAVVAERRRLGELLSQGLSPTRSLLFVGPPGVGKTLAARWLARQLNRPLLTLDLTAVMSSFLGRTGGNIRVVLDYARRTPSVLLLDEFDAIAKRRDDATEVGELKRLVTVLLQEVDDWPVDGLLIAATNHPELLDPAVWRRFDSILEFPLPDVASISQAVYSLASPAVSDASIGAIARVLRGSSFADIVRAVNRARRRSVLEGESLESTLKHEIGLLCKAAPLVDRLNFAHHLESEGHSQREISDWTGLSRDTVRKHGIARGGRPRGPQNGTQR